MLEYAKEKGKFDEEVNQDGKQFYFALLKRSLVKIEN